MTGDRSGPQIKTKHIEKNLGNWGRQAQLEVWEVSGASVITKIQIVHQVFHTQGYILKYKHR